jgi:hypothetical protein
MGCIMRVKNKINPKTNEPLMSVNEFEDRTLEAKETLEGVYKEKVIGYRAPNALVGGWMLDPNEILQLLVPLTRDAAELDWK